jgi:hypothetical protein
MRHRGNPALASGCFRSRGCLQAEGLVRHAASVAEPGERFKPSQAFRRPSNGTSMSSQRRRLPRNRTDDDVRQRLSMMTSMP